MVPDRWVTSRSGLGLEGGSTPIENMADTTRPRMTHSLMDEACPFVVPTNLREDRS